MAITLEQANVNKNTKIEEHVIDGFRRGSFLLDSLTFDDTVTPGTGGSTLSYSYTQLKTPSTAGFRKINGDYTANDAIREKKTVDLAIMGGRISIDRVLIKASTTATNELTFQINQKTKAITNEFQNGFINGDSGVVAGSFDGLNKLLTGTSTEVTAVTDLTTVTKDKSFTFIEELDNWISLLSNKPSMIFGNSKMLNKVKAVARLAGYLTQTEDAFGRKVDGFDGIPLVDLENYFDGTNSNPIIQINAGKTDLYAAWFDVNEGVHGISLAGQAPIESYLPQLSQVVDAQYPGSLELITGIAVKSTTAAGVLRGIKIQ